MNRLHFWASHCGTEGANIQGGSEGLGGGSVSSMKTAMYGLLCDGHRGAIRTDYYVVGHGTGVSDTDEDQKGFGLCQVNTNFTFGTKKDSAEYLADVKAREDPE